MTSGLRSFIQGFPLKQVVLSLGYIEILAAVAGDKDKRAKSKKVVGLSKLTTENDNYIDPSWPPGGWNRKHIQC